jgi:hypothetical protein
MKRGSKHHPDQSPEAQHARKIAYMRLYEKSGRRQELRAEKRLRFIGERTRYYLRRLTAHEKRILKQYGYTL